jgi:tripartite-type tricarboxylate transporter receptor subunit TctC
VNRLYSWGTVALLTTSLGPPGVAAVAEDYPKDPITVIVAFAAGGGTDLGARLLLPLVEKELGVPVTVVNKTGAGGWVGWSEVLKGRNDGYTLAYINTPGLMAGYMNPTVKNDKGLKDFDVIANHVVDYDVVGINPNEDRFKTIQELVDYAKTHEVTGSSTGIAIDEHILMLRMNKTLGTKFIPVHSRGASDGKTSVMGGHVDVFFGNIGDVVIAQKEKELKLIAVASPERSTFLPEVPTLSEVGYEGLEGWASRGIAVKKGIQPERLAKLVAAFEKAINSPEHKKKMDELGLPIKFMKGKEYEDFLKSDEEQVRSVMELLGWTKK